MKHALFFFGLPTIFLIFGHFLFWDVSNYDLFDAITTPILFAGLVLLGTGYYIKRKNHLTLFLAWIVFATYWSLQPEFLYYKEDGDIANAILCILGVYFLFYISYHEYLNMKRGENIHSLKFLAGSTFYAGMLYFTFKKINLLGGWLIKIVAQQSVFLLNLLGYNAKVGSIIYGINTQVPVYFNGHESVQLILACTGLQSMAVFIGVIIAIKSDFNKRIKAFLITVPTIYVLNLIRNAGVIYGVEELGFSFYFMHNVVGKIGSLIALIVIAFFVFDLLPELYDDIISIIKLYKRKGPIERLFTK